MGRPRAPQLVIDRAHLERAITWADHAYRSCNVCAERCGVDRHAGPAGVCGLGTGARIYKEYVHFGEERRLVPSHTVYFTGCSFRCAFCSDWSQVVSPLDHGIEVPPEALAMRIAQRRAEGAVNVNFVGGVPDVNLLYILKVLSHTPSDTQVVWNTNHWTTDEVVGHLGGIVATWLSDLKFGNDVCARKLSRAKDYWATLTRMLVRVPAERLLVRHLLMPGHLECCTKPVLDWLASHLPDVTVNLMTGYSPFRMAGAKGRTGPRVAMARRNRDDETNAAIAHFAGLPFADRLLDGLEWDGRL